MSNLNKDLLSIAIFATVVLVMSVTWYNMWMKPRDQMIAEIITCTDGDRSKEAYENCLAKLR